MRLPIPVLRKASLSFAGLLALCLLQIGLSGCRSDQISVNLSDPNSPQHAYKLHELAQLRMIADDIMELERRKQYGRIYDDYGSPDFRKNVNRRQFMIMSNCVETHLGGLVEYNRNELGFRRETPPSSPNRAIDVLNRKVLRSKGNIEEQMAFVPVGVSFKLDSLYWIAKEPTFLQCIEQSAVLEAQTRPAETVPAKADAPDAEPAAATAPATPPDADAPEAKPVAENATARPAAEPARPAPEPSAPKPVQEMKPAEIKRDALPARPTGAGAIKDIRPEPPAEKPAGEADHGPNGTTQAENESDL